MSNLVRRSAHEVVSPREVRSVEPTAHSVQESRLTWRDRQLERKRQSRHVVTLRDIERSAIELAAEKAAAAYVDVADNHSRRQVLSEAKWELYRAHKESQIIAGDDAELKAKFAVLDDDYFMRVRLAGLE